MRVSVEIPEQKSNGLDRALAKQFSDIQRQLLGLVKDQTDSKHEMHDMMMEEMSEHQQRLVKAMERLLGMVQSLTHAAEPADALLGALRGLKQTLSNLPHDLKSALDKQYQDVQARPVNVAVRPHVNVAMPKGFVDRLDALETAVVNGLRKSRNRTFGSNF